MSIYANTSAATIASSGGGIRETIGTTGGATTKANYSTSVPCKGCFVSCDTANSAVVKMNINAAASSTLGIDLARNFKDETQNKASAGVANPLFVPIDDVNKLYFYGTDADIIDIVWLAG